MWKRLLRVYQGSSLRGMTSLSATCRYHGPCSVTKISLDCISGGGNPFGNSNHDVDFQGVSHLVECGKKGNVSPLILVSSGNAARSRYSITPLLTSSGDYPNNDVD